MHPLDTLSSHPPTVPPGPAPSTSHPLANLADRAIQDAAAAGLRPPPDAEAARMLAEIAPALDPAPADPTALRIVQRPLPFYRQFRLCAVTDAGSLPPVTKFALYRSGGGPDDVQAIDWSPGPILAANAAERIALTAAEAPDYARFFLAFVEGDAGPMRLVEQPAELDLEAPETADLPLLDTLVHPIRAEPPEPDESGWQLTATVLYAGRLLALRLAVQADGGLSITDHTVLARDLAVAPALALR